MEHREEFATWAEFKEHVEAISVLVSIEETQDEGVIAHDHYVLLIHNVGLLLVRDNFRLV